MKRDAAPWLRTRFRGQPCLAVAIPAAIYLRRPLRFVHAILALVLLVAARALAVYKPFGNDRSWGAQVTEQRRPAGSYPQVLGQRVH